MVGSLSSAFSAFGRAGPNFTVPGPRYLLHTSVTGESGEVMTGAVARFVERTLQGSVSPFVAWMSERGQVSDTELAELEALVGQLQSKRKGR